MAEVPQIPRNLIARPYRCHRFTEYSIREYFYSVFTSITSQ